MVKHTLKILQQMLKNSKMCLNIFWTLRAMRLVLVCDRVGFPKFTSKMPDLLRHFYVISLSNITAYSNSLKSYRSCFNLSNQRKHYLVWIKNTLSVVNKCNIFKDNLHVQLKDMTHKLLKTSDPRRKDTLN